MPEKVELLMEKETLVMTVAVYLRISDDDKEHMTKTESESITNQRNLIMDYIRRKPEFDCADYIEYCDM